MLRTLPVSLFFDRAILIILAKRLLLSSSSSSLLLLLFGWSSFFAWGYLPINPGFRRLNLCGFSVCESRQPSLAFLLRSNILLSILFSYTLLVYEDGSIPTLLLRIWRQHASVAIYHNTRPVIPETSTRAVTTMNGSKLVMCIPFIAKTKLHTNTVYCTPKLCRHLLIKWRIMTRVRHVVRMWEVKRAYKIWIGEYGRNRPLGRSTRRRRLILDKSCRNGLVNWIHLSQERGHWWEPVNSKMDLPVLTHGGKFLTS
jgi:hypothetical protein